MSCENEKVISEKPFKRCPRCNNETIKNGLFYCIKCQSWYEEIDFLPKNVKYNEDCKLCYYLVETKFKKNNQILFYCNSLKTQRIMEKLRDFRKCKCFLLNKELTLKTLFPKKKINMNFSYES